jgi:pimeloyl-ACP methyl ester carboxylesterase
MLRTQPQVPDNLPQGLRGLAQAMASTYKSHRALHGELLSFRLSADQVREAAPLPDIPLVVISRGLRVWSNDTRGQRMEQLWMDLQDDLVRQNVHARLLVANEAGHYVHLDEPQIVIDAIRSVVASLRQ